MILDKFVKVNGHIDEIYQQVNMTFALVSKSCGKYRMSHEWVKCRDFLNDVVRYCITKKPVSIYGFKFCKENPEVSLDRLRIAVAHDTINNDEFKKTIKNALSMLRLFERAAGVNASTAVTAYVDSPKKKNVVVIRSNRMWLQSPVMLSIYTMLLRLGVRNDIDTTCLQSMLDSFKRIADNADGSDNDSKYLRSVHEYVYTIVIKRRELFGDKFHDVYFNDAIGLHEFHNYFGVVGVCECKINNTYLKSLKTKLMELKEQKL